MVSRKEMSRLGHLAKLVRENKTISRRQLILGSGISISYCEKLLPYIPELFTDIIFEKSTNTYQAIQAEEVKV